MEPINKELYPNLAIAHDVIFQTGAPIDLGDVKISQRSYQQQFDDVTDLYIERNGVTSHLTSNQAEAEAILRELLTAEQDALLVRLLNHAPSYQTHAELMARVKRVPGNIGRVGTTLYAVPAIDAEPIELCWKDSPALVRAIAATRVSEWLGDMRDFVTEGIAEAAKVLKSSPLYETLGHATDDAALTKHQYIRVGTEERYTVYMRSADQKEWGIVSRPKDAADNAAVADADAEIRGLAATVATPEATKLAPEMAQYAAILEDVDSKYPDMYDAEGHRLAQEEVSRLHLAYLDTQKRIMLTKSAMLAFGANARPHSQFKESYLEEVLLQTSGLSVLEDADSFVLRMELPGLKVEMIDTSYHTLLIRGLHFMTTRHDPDTDTYVNQQLRSFTQSNEELPTATDAVH